MDIKSQASPLSVSNLPQSSVKKFFSDKRNILIIEIILVAMIVIGYFIYKKSFTEPAKHAWTEEEKQQVLEDIEKDSKKTNSMFDYQKSYQVLDSIDKSSINSPARRMSEEQKLKLLESLNN